MGLNNSTHWGNPKIEQSIVYGLLEAITGGGHPSSWKYQERTNIEGPLPQPLNSSFPSLMESTNYITKQCWRCQ